MSIKKKVQEKKKIIQSKLKKSLDDIYLGEKNYNKIVNKIINIYKVFYASTKKFMADDCMTKSSSIAYTTIVSLIPTLTVALTFFSIFSGVGDKKDEIFRTITNFMLEHNIKLNIDPILDTISTLIENAGKIGGIGAVVMIFTATAVLRTLEKSLNDIWMIQKSRSFLLKIIYYWAALSLGPIIIISGTTAASQFKEALAYANYKSATVANDRLWVVGNKATIMQSGKNGFIFDQLSTDKIDFDNQKMYQYDAKDKTFKEIEFRLEESEFLKSEFTDIQFIHSKGWIIGNDGLLLMTNNYGKTWILNKLGTFAFNDIHMIDNKKGFIAANNGYLLETNDGGINWKVIEWEDVRSNLNEISFNVKKGIITCDSGIIISTNDNGVKWNVQHIDQAKKNKRYVNLYSSCLINDTDIITVGEEGTILMSKDGGKNWKKNKFLERNYFGVYFKDINTGYITGENGILLTTNDGGQRWQRKRISRHTMNKIFPADSAVWIIGDMATVKKSTDNGNEWTGIEGTNYILFLLNFLTPFISIWLLFLLIYIVLPNMKIPFKPASIGAAFTSIVWVLFILLYNVYVKSFAKGQLAIYGALAAIPIFLLMIYASSLIILYGAEVAYTLMYPHTYLRLKKSIKGKKEIHLFYGISILYYIYKKFEDGNGAAEVKELSKLTANHAEEVDYFTELFTKNNYIIKTDANNFIPANSSKNIKLSDIMSMIHDVSLSVPGTSSDHLHKYFEEIFTKMKNSKEDIIKDITLANVIEQNI